MIITKYNVLDIVDEEINDTKLKKIINKKLYRIVEIMNLNVNG